MKNEHWRMRTEEKEPIIEKNVPLPKKGRKGTPVQVLSKMEVGDSILIPIKRRASYQVSGYQLEGRKFITRTVNDEQVRIWRTE